MNLYKSVAGTVFNANDNHPAMPKDRDCLVWGPFLFYRTGYEGHWKWFVNCTMVSNPYADTSEGVEWL